MTRPVSRAANSGERLSPPRMLKLASAGNSPTGRAPERYRKQRVAATANATAAAPVRLVSRRESENEHNACETAKRQQCGQAERTAL
ncbi:hypothetical protein [Sinorhizobium americanum]|uniref:hypothetical protein n=1 Tax=Sinorhizobium americanum TaxID=194963 RepID=UPI0009345ADE|nr:hypothetical protein [Sinorhizobium americanum]